jgi:hypothetical protein
VAARAGARAALVGGDPKAAARKALPPSMRDGAEVEKEGEADEGIAVQVPVPILLPRVPEVKVGARSGLGGGGG